MPATLNLTTITNTVGNSYMYGSIVVIIWELSIYNFGAAAPKFRKLPMLLNSKGG